MRLRFPHFLCALTVTSLLASAVVGMSVVFDALQQQSVFPKTAELEREELLDFLGQVPLKKLAFIALTQSAAVVLLFMLLVCNVLLLGGWLLQGVMFAWSVSGSELKAARENATHFAIFRLIFLGAILEGMSSSADGEHVRPASDTGVTGDVAGGVRWAPGAGPLRELACWLCWFGIMGFIRFFLVLLRERFNTAQSSPYATVHTFEKYRRWTVAFTGVNVALALTLTLLAYPHTTGTVLCLLLFENAVLMASCAKLVFRYTLYIDTLRKAQPWEERGSALYYSDMLCELVVQFITLAHLLSLWRHYGLSFSVLDLFLFLHVRQLVVGAWRNIIAMRNYSRALWELNARFPDASPAELHRLHDDVCSICRDAMEQAKKLPCGHLFHRTCLQQWIEHASFCPTCRAPLLLRGAPAAQAAAAPGVPRPQPQPQAQPVHRAVAAHLQHAPPMPGQPAPGSDAGALGAAGVSGLSGLRHRSNAGVSAAAHAAAASPASMLGLNPSFSSGGAAAVHNSTAAYPGQSVFQFDARMHMASGAQGSTLVQPTGLEHAHASTPAAGTDQQPPPTVAASASLSPSASASASKDVAPTPSLRDRIYEATQRRLDGVSPREAAAAVSEHAPPVTSVSDAHPDTSLTTPASPASSSSASALPAAAAASAADMSGSDLFPLAVPGSPPMLSQADADANLARELQYEEEMLAAEEERRRREAGGITRFFTGL